MNLERRNFQVSLIKAIPFAFILFFFYLHDFLKWYSIIVSYPWVVMLVFALSISIFGAVARRKLISTYADLSKGNWPLGIAFLLAGFGFYSYGTISTTQYLAWAQFESILFFVLSYISLSYDWRIVRSTSLLYLIVGLGFPSPFLLASVGSEYTFYLSTLAMIVLFLVYAERNFRLIIAPLIAYALAFSFFYIPNGQGNVILYLIPLCFAVYAVPQVRKKLSNGRATGFECRHLWPVSDGSGFCYSCGKKYLGSSQTPRLGLAGLVLIFVILLLLSIPLVEVPVLQLYKGSTPYYNVYSYQGVSGVALPTAPPGWLTNTSSILNLTGDLYSSKNIYVPVSNPNTSNYTVYYELSQGSQTNMSNSWGNLFGWNRAQTPLGLGGLSGNLIIFTPQNTSSPADTLIVYSGHERVTFLQPFGEKTVTMQMSFTRNFSSSVDVQSAATAFVSDLQNYWVGSISNLNQASTWSAFLFSMYSLYLSINSIVAILVSSSLVAFVSYKALQGDSKADSFLEIASGLDETKWQALSSLMSTSSTRPMTELDIERLLTKKMGLKTEDVRKLVLDFEHEGLLQKVILEMRHEVLLGWRMSIKFGFI